jgi:hypothetical protein
LIYNETIVYYYNNVEYVINPDKFKIEQIDNYIFTDIRFDNTFRQLKCNIDNYNRFYLRDRIIEV